MADIGISTFAVFFLRCPSFLAARKQLESRQCASNARTLFGIDYFPTDNHYRKMLDGVEPEHFDPMLDQAAGSLEALGALDRIRWLRRRRKRK